MSGGSDADDEPETGPAGDHALPALDFPTFILSLSHSALVHLGDAPDPSTGTHEVNLHLARQVIDTVALLQEKTRGNLTGAEERVVDQVLYDLRMRFVEVSSETSNKP